MPIDWQNSSERLIARAKGQGYVTFDELNTALPAEQVASAQLEELMTRPSELGIDVVEDSPSDVPIDCRSVCSRGVRRLELAIAALRLGRVRHACQLMNTTIAELEALSEE